MKDSTRKVEANTWAKLHYYFWLEEEEKKKKIKDALKENTAPNTLATAMNSVMNDYAVLKGHMTRGYCSHLWTSTSLRF